jgi:hypothetical protein
MLNRLKGIFQFDQLIWDATFDGKEFWTVDIHLKVEDGYAAQATSRRKMHAFAFALRDIADQLLARR